MKKVITICITLFLILTLVPAAFADVDLSGMSFDELVALKDQINLALWNSAEWQEVEVPQGVWDVGADIPAGKWTIKALPGANTSIRIGNELKDGGTSVNMKISQTIKDAAYSYYNPASDVTTWSVTLEAGQYLEVSSGPAVFTPYAGKPSLGFK